MDGDAVGGVDVVVTAGGTILIISRPDVSILGHVCVASLFSWMDGPPFEHVSFCACDSGNVLGLMT